MAILIGRYLARHKGEYLTQEDKGAESALDPDSAVVRSTTGHQVQKKREWFIWYRNEQCKSTHTATDVSLNNILQLSHLLFIRINPLCLNLNSHGAKTSRKRLTSQESYGSCSSFTASTMGIRVKNSHKQTVKDK